MKTLLAIMCVSSFLSAEVVISKCTACHGLNFEKPALGKSKVVKDMKSEDIVTSLKEYKEGKGGPMKAIMVSQVKDLTEKDFKEIAKVATKDVKKEVTKEVKK